MTRWDGFCLPCGADRRPLVLTWTGRRGLRAWLAGDGWTDGELRLTCACCGAVDLVGWDDEPELLVEDEPAAADERPAPAPAPALEPAPAPVPMLVPVVVVRVLDLDAAAASVHELVPAPRTTATPPGTADGDALDLLGLTG